MAQNADQPFVPASVAKIVTAWLAMEVLGPDYRFETRFYLDRDRVLYIRGGGDPFLISEELAQLASALVAAILEPHANLLRHGHGALFKTGTFSGVRTLAGYADTSKHGRVRFVIALTSNDGAMRFRLLKAIRSEL